VKGDTKGAHLLHPERPDLAAMRTSDAHGETVFIPGSSIKGVVRSAAERVLRSIDPSRASILAEDPLDHAARSHREASSLGDDIARKSGRTEWAMGTVHKKLCLASRTFGSQAMAGRVRFTDALPTPDSRDRANQTEPRSGVSIDRRTGGPARGKLFESEVVTGGVYAATIHFENVQLWQLALLGVVLEDLDTGLVRLGSAKTRGLGSFAIDRIAIRWSQAGPERPPAGVGDLGGAEMADAYGFYRPDRLDSVPGDPTRARERLRAVLAWEGDGAWHFLRATQTGPWDAMVSAVTSGAAS